MSEVVKVDEEAALRDAPLTDFMLTLAERRGRSVLCVNRAMDQTCLENVYEIADNLDAPEGLTILLNSPGGDIGAAYRMLLALRGRVDDIEILVPGRAKSAATFLCLGADSIHMGRYGELGPLDPQMFDRSGSAVRVSALETFKALENLLGYSMNSLDAIVRLLISRTNMDVPHALDNAHPLFAAIASPLYSQIDPHELGESGRYLSVSEEYSMRVMRRWAYKDRTEEYRREIAQRLIWSYPDHGFVIDLIEAQEIGLKAERLDDESDMICGAILYMSEDLVAFQRYAPTTDSDSKTEKENDDPTAEVSSETNGSGR